MIHVLKIVGSIVIVFVCVMFSIEVREQKDQIRRLKRDLSYFEKTDLRKQGYTMGFGNYELRSLDGGKNWFAVEAKADSQVIVLGSAEEIFPGLLENLEGMDKLIAYAQKHGPITLGSGKETGAQMKLLGQAGFTVEKK